MSAFFFAAALAAAADCGAPAAYGRLTPGEFARVAQVGTNPAEPALAAAAVVVDLAPGGTARVLAPCRWAHPYDYLRASGLVGDAGHALTENMRSAEARVLVGFLSAGAGGWELSFWPDAAWSEAALARARPLLAAALGAVPSVRAPPGPGPVQVLSPGAAVGRLRLAPPFGRGDIALLKEAPKHLPDAAGLLVAEPTTELSHLSLLARSLGVPAAAARGALGDYAALAGLPVRLNVSPVGLFVEGASEAELEAADAARAARPRRVLLSADLEWEELTPLSEAGAGDAARFGAKAANLGEAARLPGVAVPPGFVVPFSWYARFVRANGLEGRAPAELAEAVRAGRHEPAFEAAVRAALGRLGARSVFVRSSTNAEDLPGFVGAGLYETVPAAVGEEAVLASVKAVWASLWSERARAARARAGLDDAGVWPAVLVQETVDAESAGVLAVSGPEVRVAAKHGFGARVVDGGASAEAWTWTAAGGARRRSASADALMLERAPGGGLREAKAPPRPVLDEKKVRALGEAGTALWHHFGRGPLDVEWAYSGGRLYIVQVRPLPN